MNQDFSPIESTFYESEAENGLAQQPSCNGNFQLGDPFGNMNCQRSCEFQNAFTTGASNTISNIQQLRYTMSNEAILPSSGYETQQLAAEESMFYTNGHLLGQTQCQGTFSSHPSGKQGGY